MTNFLSLSSTVRYILTKVSSFVPVQLVTIICDSFCPLIFDFEKFSTWIWPLPFDVYAKRRFTKILVTCHTRKSQRVKKKSDSLLQPGKHKPSHKKAYRFRLKAVILFWTLGISLTLSWSLRCTYIFSNVRTWQRYNLPFRNVLLS